MQRRSTSEGGELYFGPSPHCHTTSAPGGIPRLNGVLFGPGAVAVPLNTVPGGTTHPALRPFVPAKPNELLLGAPPVLASADPATEASINNPTENTIALPM